MTVLLQRTGLVAVAAVAIGGVLFLPLPTMALSLVLLSTAILFAVGGGSHPIGIAAMIVSVVPVIYNPPGLTPLELLYYAGVVLFVLHSAASALAGKIRIESGIDKAWVLILTFLGIGTLLGLFLTRSSKVLMDLGYFYSPILLFGGFVMALRGTDQDRSRRLYAVATALVIGFVTLRSLIMYRQSLLRVVEEWQFNFVRATGNENVLLLGAMATLAALVVRSEWRWRIPIIAASVVSWSALYLTYTRSLWGAAIIGGGVMFLAFTDSRKWKLFAQFGFFAVLLILIGTAVYPEAVGFVWKVTLARFEGFQGSAIDLSLEERIHETKAVWQAILANPVIGHGLHTPYLHYGILKGYASTMTSYIHNGYLSAWYTFGIFGLGAIIWYVGGVFSVAMRERSNKDPLARIFAYSAVGYLSGAMVMNVAAPVFASFEGWFVLILLGAWHSQFIVRDLA